MKNSLLTALRSLAKTVLPEGLLKALRRLRRHWRWRVARLRGVAITQDDLVAGLRRIGVRQGDVLLVHSSLTSLGHVEGGPDAVIDALLEVVGPDGTVAMPAYPVSGDWMTYVRSGSLFDPRHSPSAFGAITDRFWRRREAVRSLHPTHSVAAIGPKANFLIKDHERSQTPAGNPSPFRRLVDLNGRILHLGSPFWATSSFHAVEDVVTPFPRSVYLEETVPMRYLDYEGVEHTAAVKVHDPALVPFRIDKVKEKEDEIYRYCVERGIVKTSQIGPAIAHLIEAAGLERLLEELALRGITIYV